MLGSITKIFDSNEREIKKLLPIVDRINQLEDSVKKYKDSDFPSKTEELRKRVQDGESVYSVLPEAYALVREAAVRTIGLRPYDVQIMAAIVLAQGKIAEQKTGEGKTLSAVSALYLHSLTGKSVHLVTVNDYLARRDAGWMGMVFAFLGVTTASIISEASFLYDAEFTDENAKDYRLVHLKPITRQEAYQANIVYGINSEFGFDYLRDNMAVNPAELRQRYHYFAIIDEVDSVLIDEARTPHIISAPDATPSQKYYEYANMVGKLTPETDYKIDEKMRAAHLTEHGIAKIEKLYGVKDIYEKDFDTVYHIEAALKANTLFHKDKEYIVRDGEVILVDEFTGRLMQGRRLSEGLHQAIEAKEGVQVQQESKTLAMISLQNYFRMYEKLAGMTGTAITEAEEFHSIYKLDVVGIPTNNPVIRKDEPDEIYKITRAKVAAVVREIEEAHKKGQPVLVGTTSIDKNEVISEYLKRKKIPHEVLNAKNHVREALIIRDAGRKGAVTVATNMAGRGVDIILGGEPPSRFAVEYQGSEGKKRFEKEQKEWQKNHDEVVQLGGLYVIGTEKHDSRRIDNQLRGRSGRQGDPGRSMFILSLDDDLMRIFGGDSIAGLMTRFNFPEDTPLTHGLVNKVLEQAQVKVEGFNFESRKQTVDYDDVLNKQREIIYKMRRNILTGKEMPNDYVMERVEQEINRMVQFNLGDDLQENAYENILSSYLGIIPFDEQSQKQLLEQIKQKEHKEDVVEFLTGVTKQVAHSREHQFSSQVMEEVMKAIILKTIDDLWMEHLTSIEDLRTGIRLRGYAQRDPIVEYKNEAFAMFEQLIASIDSTIVSRVFRVNIEAQPQQIMQPIAEQKNMTANTPASEIGSDAAEKKSAKKATKADGAKLGRNDPCWCGSGKKWKKCHMNRDLA